MDLPQGPAGRQAARPRQVRLRLVVHLALRPCHCYSGFTAVRSNLLRRTCDGRSSCESAKGPRGRAARPAGDDLDWRERNCFCDALCAQYGDCCVDSQHYVAAQQRRSAAVFSCVDLRQFGGIYMKASCPPGWEDGDVRRRCEVSPSIFTSAFMTRE